MYLLFVLAWRITGCDTPLLISDLIIKITKCPAESKGIEPNEFIASKIFDKYTFLHVQNQIQQYFQCLN